MILAELRRVLQISESRGDEIAQEVIKGVSDSVTSHHFSHFVQG